MYMNINFHQLKLRLIEIEYPWHSDISESK